MLFPTRGRSDYPSGRPFPMRVTLDEGEFQYVYTQGGPRGHYPRSSKRRMDMTRIAVSRRKLLEGSLRTGWSGGILGDGKRARRNGVKRDKRSNHPEVVQDVAGGKEGLGAL